MSNNTLTPVEYMSKYLQSLGLNLSDPNFVETPARIVRMHKEQMFGLTLEAEDEIKNILSKRFPSKSHKMMIFPEMQITTLCPHHLLPARLKVWVAYIPDGKEVIGLSKIPRLVELLCKRPVLQEDLPDEIANALLQHTSNKGVYVIVKGRHSCMCDRGVKAQMKPVINSSIHGVFKKDATRNEALTLMGFK
jgi:GTP cyclohydrolase I